MAAWIAQPLAIHSEAFKVLEISAPKTSWIALWIIGILVPPPTISMLWRGILISREKLTNVRIERIKFFYAL